MFLHLQAPSRSKMGGIFVVETVWGKSSRTQAMSVCHRRCSELGIRLSSRVLHGMRFRSNFFREAIQHLLRTSTRSKPWPTSASETMASIKRSSSIRAGLGSLTWALVQIGLEELLAILQSWGPCQYCDQDVDRDGQVGYTELIDLMSNWGLADL